MPSPSLTVAFVLGVTPGKWAGVWAQRRPQHPLSLPMMAPEAALTAVLDGTADLALVRAPAHSELLHAIALYDELAVVVAPKDHAIEAVDAVQLADLATETVLEGPWDESIALVAAGVGVAVMPQSVARALSRRDVVARPLSDAATTRIDLVWRRDRDDALIEEFIGIVRGRTANSSRGAADSPADPADRPASPVRSPRRSTPPASRRAGPRRSGGRGR